MAKAAMAAWARVLPDPLPREMRLWGTGGQGPKGTLKRHLNCFSSHIPQLINTAPIPSPSRLTAVNQHIKSRALFLRAKQRRQEPSRENNTGTETLYFHRQAGRPPRLGDELTT